MTSITPAYRVQRGLTPKELGAVLDRIRTATSSRAVFTSAALGALGPLLADDGIAVDQLGPGQRVDPAQYAIPTTQWEAIVGAATARAAEWGTSAHIALDLINVLPSSYHDPDAPASGLPAHDHRRLVHDLHVTREACDVIAACDQHIERLRQSYGSQSALYQEAADSWHRALAGLFNMGLGADTRIRPDSHLSLIVSTGSGTTYGLIFHPARRHCTSQDCRALIDDGAAQPGHAAAGVLDHEHTPSFPLDAPPPGIWTLHS